MLTPTPEPAARPSGPAPRVAVVGLPKSGTTILTYRIAAALDGVHIDFEPPGPPRVPEDHRGPVLTKKLVGAQTADLADYRHFDRRIWICRDPRDFLVSQALYRWHREVAPEPIDVVWFDRNMELLEAKERDPGAVSFRDLEPADYFETFDAVADLWHRERAQGWFLYRYEDMVAERYDELEHYLGFTIEPEATVADGLERVVRRRGSGDWRDWFTPSDVAHYRAGGLHRYMAAFGYDETDWLLNHPTELDPRYGSEYARALFHHHRSDEPSPEPSAALPPAARPGGAEQAPGAAPSQRRTVGPIRAVARELRRLRP